MSADAKWQLLAENSYEIVIKGRLSDALIRGTGTGLIGCEDGLSRIVARDFDQLRLHTLFELFQDLNIEMVSVNATTVGWQRPCLP